MVAETRRTFPARPESLAEIRRFVRDRIGRLPGDGTVEEVVLAISEASANAVLHSGSPDIEVAVRREPRRVEVAVRDRGSFRPRPAARPDGGWGTRLMAASVDALEIRTGSAGTEVRLMKRVPASGRRDGGRGQSRTLR